MICDSVYLYISCLQYTILTLLYMACVLIAPPVGVYYNSIITTYALN